MALDYSNPYAALLRRAEEVADEAGVPLDYAPFDPSLDSDAFRPTSTSWSRRCSR